MGAQRLRDAQTYNAAWLPLKANICVFLANGDPLCDRISIETTVSVWKDSTHGCTKWSRRQLSWTVMLSTIIVTVRMILPCENPVLWVFCTIGLCSAPPNCMFTCFCGSPTLNIEKAKESNQENPTGTGPARAISCLHYLQCESHQSSGPLMSHMPLTTACKHRRQKHDSTNKPKVLCSSKNECRVCMLC